MSKTSAYPPTVHRKVSACSQRQAAWRLLNSRSGVTVNSSKGTRRGRTSRGDPASPEAPRTVPEDEPPRGDLRDAFGRDLPRRGEAGAIRHAESDSLSTQAFLGKLEREGGFRET